jgi:hypothetical protein
MLQGHRYLEPPILGVQSFARQASTSRLPETTPLPVYRVVPQERGPTTHSPSSMRGLGRRVVEAEQRMCLLRAIEDRGPPSRWPEDMSGSETPTVKYIIYNRNRTVWNSRRPANTFYPKTSPRQFPSQVY